jgi:hypothetical protein
MCGSKGVQPLVQQRPQYILGAAVEEASSTQVVASCGKSPNGPRVWGALKDGCLA